MSYLPTKPMAKSAFDTTSAMDSLREIGTNFMNDLPSVAYHSFLCFVQSSVHGYNKANNMDNNLMFSVTNGVFDTLRFNWYFGLGNQPANAP